ncbi:hypothetical protein LTR10_018171 [Elasticomyces elasticus]|uniref:Cytochrome P450 n=1 Tax=Exophiala sideris TaxID=1016849 RepID=A0ABR0J3B3_9EURO|nr:hypothetical protein LTR10_018171 [Elasticomyces elasticus]KAK5024949.1 hypothetical protein LTS07_008327 [Exophiala sideris]KAK5031462.1 hypothetical protein LTR13_007790 [Exophiala sideris]KAK5054987.1 hypothetical protein LTR69_008555 [Exophiala sideris]KAK5179868.1 hypothetical protein LTR44_007684 [Eurotiomycetes sp. CCFEE 6388]
MFSVFLGIVLVIVGLLVYEQKRDRGLPPGPARLPLIGNLHQAPNEVPWRQYAQWTKQYGPIFRLQYGLNTVIMLGNHEAAHDLLDKRSSIYSSRPRLVMADECTTKGMHVLLMKYGQQWRTHQKMQASCLNIRVSQSYQPLQDLESKQLVYELLSTNDFKSRYHRYTSSLMFALAYGRRCPHGDEPEIQGADQVNANFLYAGRVGTWAVDALPVLNRLPKFLAPWKRQADRFYNLESRLHTENMQNGLATPSWNMTKQISSMKEAQIMRLLEVAYDIGIIYEAGIDTTNIALEVFTLAAVLNPDFVQTAQRQLDEVVGPDRLPSFADKPSLPYIDAVVKEVLRWRPVSAGGIPHAVTQDDEYLGYRIPKGATVIGNHWSIHLDENIFPEPMRFRPERWLENPNLPLHAFGFGRRVCTGQHVSTNSMFIIIARLLWAFEFHRATDDKGQLLPIDDMAFTSGFNSRPQPFKMCFVPRADKVKAIVAKEWQGANKDVDAIMEDVRARQTGAK